MELNHMEQPLGKMFDSVCGTYLDHNESQQKIKDILNILNEVPIGSAKEILKEVDRLIYTSVSRVDTSLILPDFVSYTNNMQ